MRRWKILIFNAIFVAESLSQEMTTTTECPFTKPFTPFPEYPSSTQSGKTTTTAWSVPFSTETPKNSTVGVNPGFTYYPMEMYGYEMKLGKRCVFDEYYLPFRYLTEPTVCADWCRREPSCLGFMASLYSGACEAFTKCTEIDDEGWVIFYRQRTPTTTRLWAGTSPTPGNFIDLSTVPNVLSLLAPIQEHFSTYSKVLQTVFSAVNSSDSPAVMSPGVRFPMTKLSLSQTMVFERTLEMAWKARIIFAYQQVEGWVLDVPQEPIDAPLANTQAPSGTGRKYKCNQGTVDSACKLLKLNNEGKLFLLPWNWEAFHNKDMIQTPAPDSVTPLFSIMTLCYGEAPPTYTNELVCPDPAMLNAIGALANSVFNAYSLPLYVASMLGTPVYDDEEGRPSVTHFYGSGVDFLCGVGIYGAAERGFDESCDLMMRYLRKPQFGAATPCDDAYVPAGDANVGCGEPWWPVPTVHCDRTIVGSKK